MGALALAAGSLISTRPDRALAANGDPVLAGGSTYAAGGTTLYLNNPGTPLGVEWAQAMINRNGTLGSPVAAFGGVAMPAAPTGSTGVWGFAWEAPHYGVHAEHYRAAGTALRVDGRAHFSRSGKATIAKGTAHKHVTVASGIGTGAMILVTLQGSAGTGRYVRYAKRASTTSFEVWLNTTSAYNVQFAWLIID